jgi:hypothetical protein
MSSRMCQEGTLDDTATRLGLNGYFRPAVEKPEDTRYTDEQRSAMIKRFGPRLKYRF